MQSHRVTVGRFVSAVMVVALTCAGVWGAEEPTRNAIFNGAFVEGVSAFGVLGPGYKAVTLSADKSQHAQTLLTELIVSCPGMERTFSVYSTYLLQLRPGREYQITLRMAGVGHFAFGAFEYDAEGHHLGNNYSERHVLTPEFQQFSFTYKPSPNAVAIRPSIVFLEAPDGTRLDVRARVRSFELPVPAGEFGEMCKSWPDYAKDDVFASYQGFSAEELKALQELERADDVLPPYQPIKMTAPGDFTLTTSRLECGKGVLPQRLSVRGVDVLARPMELAVTYADGTRLKLQPGGTTIRTVGSSRRLSQQARAGGHSLTADAELHYDAFVIYTLSFPQAAGAAVTGVTLTIPFAKKVARYLSYDKVAVPGGAGWVFGYGPIPRPGERVETKAVVGSAHMGEANANDWKPEVPGAEGRLWEWQRGFPQMIWVGDESRGLSLVSLSTQNYQAAPDMPTVRLTRHGDEVVLAYSFITGNVPLDKPRKLQFALQIMPPKPVRGDWFAARYNAVFPGYPEVADQSLPLLAERLKPGAATSSPDAVRPYLTAYEVVREGAAPQPWQPRTRRRYRDIGFLWYTLWSQGARASGLPVGGCSTPLVGHPERLSKLVKVSELMGHRALPYFAATHIAAEDPAGYHHVERTDEWTQHPRVPRPPYLRPTCPNSLCSAYIARGIGKLIDDYGIAGVYFDNCAPQLCQNTGHGCGYVDDEGVLQPTLPLLGFRKLFRMVRAEFVKRGKEPFILTHAGMHPGTVSFTDAELQGEGTYGSDHTAMLTLGEWRARWLGPSQFGVQMTYLPAFGYGLGPNVDRAAEGVTGTPRLLAMSLLHGTQVWNQYLDTPLLFRAWTVLDELEDPDVTFIPYWQWPLVNQALNGQNVYATAYSGKDRLLLVLANLGESEREIALPLASVRSANQSVSRVADHMHNLPVQLEGGTVKCTVGAKNFRLLSFSK